MYKLAFYEPPFATESGECFVVLFEEFGDSFKYLGHKVCSTFKNVSKFNLDKEQDVFLFLDSIADDFLLGVDLQWSNLDNIVSLEYESIKDWLCFEVDFS